MEAEKDFYSIREIADLLHVAISTVHRYIEDKLLDAYQIGGRGPWRVKKEVFQGFISKNK